MRGFFAGFLLLTGLEAVLSSSHGAATAGGLLEIVGSLVNHVLDPTVPAIADHRKPKTGRGGLLGQLEQGVGGIVLPGIGIFSSTAMPAHAPVPTVTV